MKALSHGKIIEALQFNPLAVLGVFAVGVWFAWTVKTMGKTSQPHDAKEGEDGSCHRTITRRWGIVFTVLVLLNWLYLVCFLPS